MYKNFENILKERNMTPYQVAKKTGVATATLSAWKKGIYRPKIDKLLKIANCLEVPLEKLIETE